MQPQVLPERLEPRYPLLLPPPARKLKFRPQPPGRDPTRLPKLRSCRMTNRWLRQMETFLRNGMAFRGLQKKGTCTILDCLALHSQGIVLLTPQFVR
jgi:hypothetical protein